MDCAQPRATSAGAEKSVAERMVRRLDATGRERSAIGGALVLEGTTLAWFNILHLLKGALLVLSLSTPSSKAKIERRLQEAQHSIERGSPYPAGQEEGSPPNIPQSSQAIQK